MGRYNDRFTLDPGDLELIEQALESQVTMRLAPGAEREAEMDIVHRIRRLLGKLHNQKIFYSHANPGDCPLG